LQAGAAAAFPRRSTFAVSSGATLDLNGFNQTIARAAVIGHKPGVPADVAAHVRARAVSLLDDWSSLAHDRNSDGTTFGYGREPGISKTLLHEVLERGLELADERERRFRTPRSFRDVEPPVLLRKVAPNGAEIDEDRA
jgi:hypothetical protein